MEKDPEGNALILRNISHLFFLINVTIVLHFLLNKSLFAQNFVKDTITISFKNFDKIKSDVIIDTVIDQRDENSRLIGKYEKSKYLFIPVDLWIYTKNPLCNEIHETIQTSINNDDPLRFNLIIEEFKLTRKTNSLLYPRYLLYSSVQVYQSNIDSEPRYMGKLLYESTSRKPLWGDKLKKGFESVARNWYKELISDINKLSNDFKAQQPPALENFRSGTYNTKPINMIAGVDVSAGTKGWMTDWEIFFSHREVKKRFYRSGYNIRYRNADTFESIEFGLSNDYLLYRWRPNIIFRGKSQLMFGFNSWNDFNTTDHEIWDALILDYSLSQCFIYNPIDKRSILFGLGLMGNIYYVYSRRIQFQFGLLLNFGIKL
jgi:hypothetical protein